MEAVGTSELVPVYFAVKWQLIRQMPQRRAITNSFGFMHERKRNGSLNTSRRCRYAGGLAASVLLTENDVIIEFDRRPQSVAAESYDVIASGDDVIRELRGRGATWAPATTATSPRY